MFFCFFSHTLPRKKQFKILQTLNGFVLPPDKSEDYDTVAKAIASRVFKV
jgi:hypothetical protein